MRGTRIRAVNAMLGTGALPMKKKSDPFSFDAKVSSLVQATQKLAISQILVLRRLTLADPESLKWASERQLNVVFDVILSKAIERTDRIQLLTAVDKDYEPLLPAASSRDPQDKVILARLVNAVIGTPGAMLKKQNEAEQAQADFEILLARRLPSTPPRMRRSNTPFREAPPLFNVQGGLKSTSAAQKSGDPSSPDSASGIAEAHHHQVDFSTLFDDTICGHIRKILDLLRVPADIQDPQGRPRVPFMVAPEFSATMEDVMRRYILPQIKASRQVKSLANAYNWAQVGGEQLIEIIQGSEINNPILHNWDLVWNTYKTDGKNPKDSPWAVFREDATNCNYSPPDKEHIRLLMDLIRYEPEGIAKCWRELQDLSQQEFSPSGRQERARDGALRDGILKWSAKLPDFVGEFLAIKAAFTFQACTHDYMRSLVTNYGRNDQDRRRNAPFLCQFVDGLRD